MGKESKTPAIRFKGFTNAWEQRKLGDVGKARSGFGFPDVEQDGAEGIPFFKVSDMNSFGNENEMTTSNNYVTETQIAKRRWKPIDEVPAMFFAKVGAAVMLNRKRLVRFPFLLDNNTMAYSFNEECWSAAFGKALFEKIDLTSLIQVGALPSYNARDVENIEIFLPTIQEQKQIGDFFRHLDNLITLHQRKLLKLKNVKKAMLEKMFPKNGSNVPEIRFAGFTDAWEQRKLREIAETRRGLTYNPTNIREAGIRVLRSSNIDEDRFAMGVDDVFVEEDAINIPFAKNGDILITSANGSSRLVGKHAIIQGIQEKSTVHGGFMLAASTRFPEFLNASMSSPWYSKFINLFVAGGNGAIGNLNKNDLDEQLVSIPTEEEQQQIGAYFQQLDNLIALHQRKLEKLKNVKKACLEKMFV